MEKESNMKKILVFLGLAMFIFMPKANAMTFQEAMAQDKPVALLVYANWADGVNEMRQQFNNMSQTFGDRYNFVTLDIASQDTKYFNSMYHIYPNLPYVLFFKNNGKITRYLQKQCIMDTACFKERLEFFLN